MLTPPRRLVDAMLKAVHILNYKCYAYCTNLKYF